VRYKELFRKKSIAHMEKSMKEHAMLKRNLTLRDLTSFGIAAIIGAGIFGTIGQASFDGGPAVSLLFIFTAVACLFSALCYAQFASSVPLSGSAYTYAYTAFGELIAWIIGWDLLMEYAIGNIAVAITWSGYFTGLLEGFNIHIPYFLTTDIVTAGRAFDEVQMLMAKGVSFSSLKLPLKEAYQAWISAPQIGNLKIIFDLPALGITAFITSLVYIGIKETKTAGNIMVLIKLVVVLMVIAVGAFYINPDNWSPFAPNGVPGVMKGVSAVFFAYIGFDAISTTAEESINPQRDMPRSMIFSLAICTLLYIGVTLVLTGMVSYKELNVDDPLAYVFQRVNLNFIGGVVAISAIFAMAGVLLVFQLGQPRIWMSMSRDGLLPKIFSRIHPKFKTPSFSTILTGGIVATGTLFMNLKEVTELTSIGTLFAFVLVCGGVLISDASQLKSGAFRVPYYNGKYVVPGLMVIAAFFLFICKENFTTDLTQIHHKIPLFVFILFCIVISVFSYLKNLSLIPVLGLICDLFLMTKLDISNWLRFFIWLLLGLLIYFIYGFRHSHLNRDEI
jgi:basic amino acid/polyamine antiporter, APA family